MKEDDVVVVLPQLVHITYIVVSNLMEASNGEALEGGL